jgi:hypothetical protein
MTKLLINAITNCINYPSLAEDFDALFSSYQRLVNQAYGNAAPESGVKCIYIQFQFDADWDGAVRGTHIGRYGRKSRSIQAEIEIKASDFRPRNNRERKCLINEALIETLARIAGKLPADEPHQVLALLEGVKNLGLQFLKATITDGRCGLDGSPIVTDLETSNGCNEAPCSTSMRYQLVLQMTASAIKHYDATIEIEDAASMTFAVGKGGWGRAGRTSIWSPPGR